MAPRAGRCRGLDAVSVRDIAAEAGVSLSAINDYFGSRINLLVTILQMRVAEIEQARMFLSRAVIAATPELRAQIERPAGGSTS